eukprot:688690-Hanusia_phi.AAC.1
MPNMLIPQRKKKAAQIDSEESGHTRRGEKRRGEERRGEERKGGEMIEDRTEREGNNSRTHVS